MTKVKLKAFVKSIEVVLVPPLLSGSLATSLNPGYVLGCICFAVRVPVTGSTYTCLALDGATGLGSVLAGFAAVLAVTVITLAYDFKSKC